MLDKKRLTQIVNIGLELTTQKDKNKLLDMILEKAMEMTECDAGTLYLYKNDSLYFKLMKTLSMNINKGSHGEQIDLPPVPMNENHVCSYSAIHKELINIPDVYSSKRFDFSGPKKYDALTGYNTKSMIVIPMTDNEDQLMGVIQLINAKNNNGDVVAFTKDEEFILRSLSSLAAVSISNMLYVEEIKRQLYSFAEALATAIDERTPYNGSHTRKVTDYVAKLADYINKMYAMGISDEYFDCNRKEQLELAATLHDIGKMIVPLKVMNKATRLGDKIEKLKNRYKLIEAYIRIDYLEGRLSKEKYEQEINYLKESLEFICTNESAGFMSEENITKVKDIATHVYEFEGQKYPYLTPYEEKCMSIVKGTLTQEERTIMESHVVMTKKILEKVHFNASYSKVTKFASTHHELLDGSGYPDKLTKEDIELESRMLAVVDVYDALTATDRPYKKPMEKDKAFKILDSMVLEGKLDKKVVEWFKKAIEGK